MKFTLSYNFKVIQEALWFTGISVAIFIATEFAGKSDYSDWKDWIPVLVGGCLRAAGGAILAVLTKAGTFTKS